MEAYWNKEMQMKELKTSEIGVGAVGLGLAGAGGFAAVSLLTSTNDDTREATTLDE